MCDRQNDNFAIEVDDVRTDEAHVSGTFCPSMPYSDFSVQPKLNDNGEGDNPQSPLLKTAERENYSLSAKDQITQKMQELVEQMNVKRKRDGSLLADFKKTLDLQVTKSCGILEKAMYAMYCRNGKEIETKLQELVKVLDRIAKLEAELQDFKDALGLLYQDIAHSKDQAQLSAQ